MRGAAGPRHAMAAAPGDARVVRFASAEAMAVACAGAACRTTWPWLRTALVRDAAALPDDSAVLVEADAPVVGFIVNASAAVAAAADVAFAAAANATACPSWGLDRINQRKLPLDGKCAHRRTGADVRIYVVDSGVNEEHDEFRGRLVPGADFVDDGRGYGEDCQGHGTHTAGIALGARYGVAPGASLVPVRVLDCDGNGNTSRVLAALAWIAEAHAEARDPGVVLLSIGGTHSPILNAAVRDLIATRLVVVVAAGNVAEPVASFSPASEPHALTIAASMQDDTLAPFSNVGPGVDVVAPGDSIRSAWVGGPAAERIVSGTSMAAPFAAGAAARLLANTPTLTPTEVARLLARCATRGALRFLRGGTPDRLLRVPCRRLPSSRSPSPGSLPASAW